MNSIAQIFWILLFLICCQFSGSKQSRTSVKSPKFADEVAMGEPVGVDTSQSLIEWKGTKLMGAGSHKGIIRFKEGQLRFLEGELTGGSFTVDMKSIYITDIPLSDPIPRANLLTHLQSDFNVKKYPESYFRISKILSENKKRYLEGDLIIKGHSENVRVSFRKVNQSTFVSEFSINRFKWGIGEDGSWLEKKLVDPDIYLKVLLVLNSKG